VVLFAAVAAVLAAHLGVPRAVEPYPAIFMPAGGGGHRYSPDEIRYSRRAMLACAPVGPCTRLEVADVLFDFHSAVRMGVMRGHFGFATRVGEPTPVEVRASRVWLRRRLTELAGHPVSRFQLIKERYSYRISGARSTPPLETVVYAEYDL
jgi:hypothetical protein